MSASSAPTICPAVTRPWFAGGPGPATDLIGALPDPSGSLCFVHAGGGLVGWGVHAATRVTGADAADRIADWYAEQLRLLAVTDEVGAPGTGPVCFVSLGFAAADPSVAVIPRTVVGRVDGASFVTVIGHGRGPGPTSPVTAPGQVRYSDPAMSTAGFTGAVAEAVGRIRAGQAEKVVLAHGLQAVTEHPVDERYLLTRLAARYPSCATFAVDGLVGASPEMLVRRRGAAITSRVLAGTAWPESPDGPDTGSAPGLAAHLLASPKDLSEHRFAVRSVADALRGVTSWLDVPPTPSALALANLTHLATDIGGRLAGPDAEVPSALDVAALLHPTAAVGGTPTDVAMQLIAEIEPDRRGRYAAPVGWVDARGDGEFAIALRCAEISGTAVRMMAGCGIVAGSDPETEAREAQIKMVPMRDALEADR